MPSISHVVGNVSSGAKIADGTKIADGAKIADGTKIADGAKIADGTKIVSLIEFIKRKPYHSYNHRRDNSPVSYVIH